MPATLGFLVASSPCASAQASGGNKSDNSSGSDNNNGGSNSSSNAIIEAMHTLAECGLIVAQPMTAAAPDTWRIGIVDDPPSSRTSMALKVPGQRMSTERILDAWSVLLPAMYSSFPSQSRSSCTSGRVGSDDIGMDDVGMDDAPRRIVRFMDPGMHLARLYQTLDSPNPSHFKAARDDHSTTCSVLDPQEVLAAAQSESPMDGMKTALFKYQRRSLWKLLQRELLPQRTASPWMLPLDTRGPLATWLDLRTGYVHRWQPPHIQPGGTYADTAGGIICEEMGTGKTILCLALIVATRQYQSQPPPGRQVYPCATRDMPLKERAALVLATHGVSIRNLGLAFPDCVKYTTPWYMLHPPSPNSQRQHPLSSPTTTVAASDPTSGSNGPNQPIAVLLSSATLVVVPDTLVDQWRSEINKHVGDNVLEYIVVPNSGTAIPDAHQLAKLDLVIISHSRFGLEHKRGKVMWQFGVQRKCVCPYQGNTRTVVCACPRSKTLRVSPLLQVRWLRLIVDEGHTLAKAGVAETTLQIDMAHQLECDHRWICTGTPMQNSVNHFSATVERNDVDKLGAILTEYLGIEPFSSNRGLLKHILQSCPVALRYEVLGNIMGRIMVRNRHEDVVCDVQLPPLTVATVVLDFNELQKLAYNALLGLIGLNAVLSEREDQDYFFHKSNVKPLRQAVSNVLASCQWFGGTEFMATIQEANSNLEKALAKQPDAKYSPADMKLLVQIRETFEQLLSHPQWHGLAQLSEAPFLATGFRPHGIPWQTDAFHLDVGAHKGLQPVSWSTIQMFRARYASQCHSASPEQAVSDAERAAADVGRNAGSLPLSAIDQAETRPSDHIAGGSILSSQNSHGQSHEEGNSSGGICADSQQAAETRQDVLFSTTAMEASHIVGALSAKWAYLLEQMTKTKRLGEKMLVYVQTHNDIDYLHKLCQVAGIRCLLFHSLMKIKERSKNITTFNTASNIHAMIMDAKISAWGIDLSSASRVYFVSPIWQSDMERQAIKRAHRIGCTRPVFVESLVIRGTVEEDMLASKAPATAEGGIPNRSRAPDAEDAKIQRLLKDVRLIPLASSHTQEQQTWSSQPTLSVPLPLVLTGHDADVYSDTIQPLTNRRVSKDKTRPPKLTPDRSIQAVQRTLDDGVHAQTAHGKRGYQDSADDGGMDSIRVGNDKRPRRVQFTE
ncbi:SNF2 family N-terminal domain-containing protein [Entophlyctis helioformis]|nr:SNF2 family N-terminal domain-containing protein [Entophlyctis helioformis]